MTPEEMTALRRLGPVLIPHLPEIIERFYEHLLQFPAVQAHLNKPGLVERLKAAQINYFHTLLRGNVDEDYIAARKLIGKTHERIGLEPRWYIGGYALFCQLIFPIIREHFRNDPAEIEFFQLALLKAFFLDMQIAMETYIDRYAGELVDARRTLEQKLWLEDSLLSFILTEASDAIVGLDEQDRISTWSQGAQRIFGYKTKEILDKCLADLLDKPEIIDQIKRTANDKGSALIYGSDWKAKDGNVITADATLTLLRDDQGSPIGSTLILRDTTEIRRLASKVKNMEQLAAMTKVTASVAHEIRTPLGVMALTGDILSERIEEIFEKVSDPNRDAFRGELLELVGDLQVEVDRLNEIVDHYLVLSRIKRPTKVRIHLQSYLEETMKDLSTRDTQKPIQTTFNGNLDDIYVDIDPDHIRRVFQNLYENARFATRASGAISVRTHMKDDKIQIEFQDTGVGIPEDMMKKLFSAFVTNKPGGTGLGLYLVREIVEAHDGSVNIESREGHGSTITLILPKATDEVDTDGTAL